MSSDQPLRDSLLGEHEFKKRSKDSSVSGGESVYKAKKEKKQKKERIRSDVGLLNVASDPLAGKKRPNRAKSPSSSSGGEHSRRSKGNPFENDSIVVEQKFSLAHAIFPCCDFLRGSRYQIHSASEDWEKKQQILYAEEKSNYIARCACCKSRGMQLKVYDREGRHAKSVIQASKPFHFQCCPCLSMCLPVDPEFIVQEGDRVIARVKNTSLGCCQGRGFCNSEIQVTSGFSDDVSWVVRGNYCQRMAGCCGEAEYGIYPGDPVADRNLQPVGAVIGSNLTCGEWIRRISRYNVAFPEKEMSLKGPEQDRKSILFSVLSLGIFG